MRKMLFTSSILALPLLLVGCQAVNGVGKAGNAVVGAGVKVVDETGSVIGKGVDFLTGKPASAHDVKKYHQQGIVYHNGHKYKIVKGKYVLVK